MVYIERRILFVRAISLSEEGEEFLRRVGELIAPLVDNHIKLQRTLDDQQSILGEQKSVLREQQSILGLLGKQQRLLEGLVEDGARQQITKMLGDDYHRPLLARSLQDLALLLPNEAVHKSS
jgi:hypothetical protein